MAHDQFKAFLEAVSADSSLQEKLNSAADADAVVAIAKMAGFVISAEAVEKKLEESEEELTAEQLEAVTGGAFGIGKKKGQGSRNKNAADSTFRTALPMHSLWSNDGKRF